MLYNVDNKYVKAAINLTTEKEIILMGNIILFIFMLIIFGYILFYIIVGAVKMAVKEVLYEFKKDIMKELNQNKVKEENKSEQ